MINQIHIGPLTFHLYGLIIAVAIAVGYYLAKERAKLYRIDLKLFDNPILILPLILAIIGARAYHVLDYWRLYQNNPISIFYISQGGLGVWGALIGAFVGFFIVAKVKKLSLLPVLDLVSPSVILGQSIGRIGNFINQEGFGPPTDKPWGVYINTQNRPAQFSTSNHFHPTFFYEAILDFIFFVVLITFAKKVKKEGQVFALYLIFYSISRFIAESWRIDTWTIGVVKIAHAISLFVFIIGLLLFFNLKKMIRSV